MASSQEIFLGAQPRLVAACAGVLPRFEDAANEARASHMSHQVWEIGSVMLRQHLLVAARADASSTWNTSALGPVRTSF